MNKILWVAAPLVIFALWAIARMVTGRPLRRHAFNVFESLLLLVYFFCTVGLGVFWVANQQLPVFDWHYLFGYATTLLVMIHLVVNWRVVTAYFKGRGRSAGNTFGTQQQPQARRPFVALWSFIGPVFLLLIGYYLGSRYASRSLPSAPLPGVPSAAMASVSTSPEAIHLVEQYHEFSSHDRAGIFTRAAGVDWGAPPEPYKNYEGRPAISLPPPRGDRYSTYSVSAALHGECPPATVPLDVQALGDMLHYTSGITAVSGGIALRASPSSGALFPSDFYIFVNDVAGLERGLYYYHPEGHRLISLPHSDDVDLSLGNGDARLRQARAVVLLASIFRRTGYKYRDRAYRYATADAGHALENFFTAATSLGLTAHPLRQFDDSLAEKLIALDARDEGVLAVIPIEASCSSAEPEYGASTADEDESVTTTVGVTGIVHSATSLDMASANLPDTDATGTKRIKLLPPVAAPAAPLATMAARRSIRRYSDKPLSFADLSSLLHYVGRAPTRLSDAVRINVVIHSAEKVEPGTYLYDRETHELILRSAGERRAEAAAAALNQEVIGGGALSFVLSLNRRLLFQRDGARGYRHGFLEAGMMGERIYLEAVARSLGACAVGAFFDDEAARLIAADPNEEWVVHFAAVGHKD